MMALDAFNNLNSWPLAGLDKFIEECQERHIYEINVTGTNTDPLLYEHTHLLKEALLEEIPHLEFGIRTNGVLALKRPDVMSLYHKGSISITTLDPGFYKQTMGSGAPPNIEAILDKYPDIDLKVNIILCPEVIQDRADLLVTLFALDRLGFKRVNLREPYGQAHIGDPLAKITKPFKETLGMPTYRVGDMEVTYWDVHFVHVESVNLYAQGRVSIEYPITKGHDENGIVIDQSNWSSGRHVEQWQSSKP